MKPTEAELKLINEKFGTHFTEDDIEVHEELMLGSELVEDRFVQFPKPTLERFSRTTGSFPGIPEKFNHLRHSALIGRSFDSSVKDELGSTIRVNGAKVEHGQGLTTNLYAKFYVQKGLNLQDGSPYASTDDIAKAIEGHTVHDTSVEVVYGKLECSICHNDIRDWQNCMHWPGGVYKSGDHEELCFILAREEGSDILANAFVDAGAYHSAGIVPRGSLAAGDFSSDAPMIPVHNLKLLPLEMQTVAAFSQNSQQTYIAGTNTGAYHDHLHALYQLPDADKAAIHKAHKELVKELGSEHEQKDALDGALPKTLKREVNHVNEEQLRAELERVNALNSTLTTERDELKVKVNDLEPKAALAEEVRKNLITQTLESGVRAYGEKFDTALYTGILEKADFATINGLKAQFDTAAKAALTAGRQTEGSDPDKGKTDEAALTADIRSTLAAKNVPMKDGDN